MECLYPLEGRCWPESVVFSPSYVRLIVHPELLVRAISRSCLELLRVEFKHKWLHGSLPILLRKRYLKPEDRVLFGDS